jgi:Flp pilus assembly protein TadD
MYLPLAAVAAAIVLGAHLAVTRFMGHWTRPAAGAAAVVLLITVGALGAATRARNAVYASAEGLWADTVAKRPEDPRPRVAYGEALARAGRLSEAETQLWRAVELAPDGPVARVRLGSVLAQQSRYEQAVAQLNAALALRPADVDAHRFLGEIYAIERRDAQALEHYSKALALVPGDPQIMAKIAALRARR